jgi:hypothetical protein
MEQYRIQAASLAAEAFSDNKSAATPISFFLM